MNHATFFKYFELLADQPDAVARMRDLILDIAVRGKLVQQDSKDKPAISNLFEIEEEKRALISARKLRQNLVTEISKTKSLQYEIPKAWRWFRLGDVVFFQEGPGIRNWQFKTQGIKLLNVQNIVDGKLVLENSDRYISAEEFEKTYKHFAVETGDILFASSGGSWGKIAWFENPGYTVMLNTSMVRLKFYSKRCDDKFLFLFLRTAFFRTQMEIQLAGIQPNFGSTHLGRVYIPLPPLAEQRRIVAKVDELMALCDELEKRQEARRETRKKVQHATLHHLLEAREPKTFATGWQRVRDHFHQLHETPDSIPKLRQTILQLAVQGRLVPQKSSEGDGKKVVEQILEKRGIKSAADTSDGLPDIPQTWAAISVSDVFEVAGGIQKTPLRAPQNNAFPYLRVANVQRGRLSLDDVQEFELGEGELERWRLQPKDLLIVEGNGSEDEIGRCAQWNGELPNCVHQNHIIRCRPIGHDAKFIILFFNSPAGIREMKERAITTSGLYSLSVGKIRTLPIPFPPLAEQKRIVARVEELMRLCDALESQLNQSQTLGIRFLESTLHHLLAA